MLRKATVFIATLALFTAACGSEPKDEPAPPISMAAVDNLVPGQLARGAALQTEIRSAGHDCNKVVRTFQQGVRDGEDIWDAECEGGNEYAVVSKADGMTDVLECAALESQTDTSCWVKF